MDTLQIAKVCHEANKSFCEAHGDYSQDNWELAPEWQKKSAQLGVEFRIKNPDGKVSAQHEAWMKQKIEEGWVYGEIKAVEKKTHPCIVPFDQLPEFQQKKDKLFVAIVDALK